MVTQPSLQEPFKPLVYPLIQVIDSTINLIPTARYYPLRLHCIDLYIQIASATGVYIPAGPLLLDIIEVYLIARSHVEQQVPGEADLHRQTP